MRQGRELRRLTRTLLVGLVLLTPGCGENGPTASEERLAAYREDGIVLGVSPEPPYGYEQDGDVTGGHPELAREVLRRLGIEVKDYVMTDFGHVLDGLEADRLDIISAAMFVTPERAEKVLFADPDACSLTAFVVPAGNPHGLVDYADVIDAGITLGLVSGTFQQHEARRSGIVDSEVYPINETALAALEDGEVEAVALTTFTANYETADNDDYEGTEGFLPVIDGEEQLGCAAFGFRYEDEALRDAFNEELSAMQEAGEVLPVVDEFYGDDAEPLDIAADLTADELAGVEP
jgi:polar amino acid transport system substrate-binding protein